MKEVEDVKVVKENAGFLKSPKLLHDLHILHFLHVYVYVAYCAAPIKCSET